MSQLKKYNYLIKNMDRFKDYDINETKKIVDDIYVNWIEAKNKYNDKILDNLSDSIYINFEADIKHSEFYEKKEYWFQKFKDEEIIINKLKREFGWWKK
jgi:hypothetical protein